VRPDKIKNAKSQFPKKDTWVVHCVLSHDFARIVKRAGLKGVRFHDLRHTFASLMLLRGAKPKVISEALGHASVAFTMDTYSHIIEGMQEDAMALLDEVLPAGVSQKLTPN
jgi:integrase